MQRNDAHIGAARDRVDGRAKVTGSARYAAEFAASDLAYGYIVSSAAARGRIASIDTSAAEAVPGVVKVFTHENRPRAAWFSYNYQDQVGPPGKPFRPLYDAEIQHSGQAIALVVADTYEAARAAADLVVVEYDTEPHQTDLSQARAQAYVPPKKRSGIAPPPKPRGDAMGAYASAEARVYGEYSIATEHHNPMELFATTVVWEGDGKLTVHDKTQGVQNGQSYVTSVFGLSADDVRVVSPFVGGGFGSGLRPQHQLFLAVMATLDLQRSIRVEMTRAQMFSFVHRPETINNVWLGAKADGVLTALRHEAIGATSMYEDHQEVVVNWSTLLYHAPNSTLVYKLAKLDIASPGDMRAPGAPLGVFAIESAMDELAAATGVDPIELRLRNYTERDENQNKAFTSKSLRACFSEGAAKFGWERRTPAPRSMREGRELVGYGMASGVWEAGMMKTTARAVFSADGRLEVATATSDIGTGTYTILTQIAADALGLDMELVSAKIGDSSLPYSPVEGGSWTAASAGAAVDAACAALRKELLACAASVDGSPFAKATVDDVVFAGGRMSLLADAAVSVTLTEAMRAAGRDCITVEETASPSLIEQMRSVAYTHSAVFAEARVDEQLGQVRIERVVCAVAAGRILNPKTARSQILGGVVWGLGMALHEETFSDHRLGRFMNRNLGEYHVPANADIENIEVIFVEEHDEKASPLGVKGLGEIGIVGTAAAVANAIHHATGVRVRSLPITIDKVLAGL